MLSTYRHQCEVGGVGMANSERVRKVRRSMARIKVVMGERWRAMKEQVEGKDSGWRVSRDKKKAMRDKIRGQERRRNALPTQHFRQRETHPKRKKIKFRQTHPRPAPPSTEQSSEQISQSV